MKCSPLRRLKSDVLIVRGCVLGLHIGYSHNRCGISLKSGKEVSQQGVRLDLFVLVCGKVTQLLSCFAPKGGGTAGTAIKTGEGHGVGF